MKYKIEMKLHCRRKAARIQGMRYETEMKSHCEMTALQLPLKNRTKFETSASALLSLFLTIPFALREMARPKIALPKHVNLDIMHTSRVESGSIRSRIVERKFVQVQAILFQAIGYTVFMPRRAKFGST